jgi:hypothetical protein
VRRALAVLSFINTEGKMSFSRKTKEDVLVASKRYCCLCEVFCGLKIEIHHILQVCEGGGDSFENAIALCLNCHADMKSYDHQHPKGTKYRSTELKRRRNDLYKKVKSGLTQNHKIEISEHDKNVYSRLKWSSHFGHGFIVFPIPVFRFIRGQSTVV